MFTQKKKREGEQGCVLLRSRRAKCVKLQTQNEFFKLRILFSVCQDFTWYLVCYTGTKKTRRGQVAIVSAPTSSARLWAGSSACVRMQLAASAKFELALL